MFALAPLLSLLLILPHVLSANVTATCVILEAELPASSVFYLGSPEYSEAMSHFSTVNMQQSTCVVQPTTQEHVGTILKTLASTETPFAVKSGGHGTNPGFSSTTGVHISLKKFSEVNYDSEEKLVTIGAGLVWDDVYTVLDPLGVGVVGARVTGVGVGGFLLGGGYSYKTNQYGLGVDNVVAYNVVLPNGTPATATKDKYKDLFWALKGGSNNFGIVTSFVLQTNPQVGGVWGGVISYAPDQYPAFADAFDKFVNTVKDPKASLFPFYNWINGTGEFILSYFFYDSPTLPTGVFDDFLAIPQLTTNVGTRGMASVVNPNNDTTQVSARIYFDTVSVRDWSPSLIKLVEEETLYWAANLSSKTGVVISYDIEPFLDDYLAHNKLPSAYPPDSARDPNVSTTPMNIVFGWVDPAYDADFLAAITETASRIRSLVASEQGAQYENSPRYNNYAIYDTPLSSIYGENLPVLEKLKKKYDSQGVMGLTGGWKL